MFSIFIIPEATKLLVQPSITLLISLLVDSSFTAISTLTEPSSFTTFLVSKNNNCALFFLKVLRIWVDRFSFAILDSSVSESNTLVREFKLLANVLNKGILDPLFSHSFIISWTVLHLAKVLDNTFQAISKLTVVGNPVAWFLIVTNLPFSSNFWLGKQAINIFTAGRALDLDDTSNEDLVWALRPALSCSPDSLLSVSESLSSSVLLTITLNFLSSSFIRSEKVSNFSYISVLTSACALVKVPLLSKASLILGSNAAFILDKSRLSKLPLNLISLSNNDADNKALTVSSICVLLILFISTPLYLNGAPRLLFLYLSINSCTFLSSTFIFLKEPEFIFLNRLYIALSLLLNQVLTKYLSLLKNLFTMLRSGSVVSSI